MQRNNRSNSSSTAVVVEAEAAAVVVTAAAAAVAARNTRAGSYEPLALDCRTLSLPGASRRVETLCCNGVVSSQPVDLDFERLGGNDFGGTQR